MEIRFAKQRTIAFRFESRDKYTPTVKSIEQEAIMFCDNTDCLIASSVLDHRRLFPLPVLFFFFFSSFFFLFWIMVERLHQRDKEKWKSKETEKLKRSRETLKVDSMIVPFVDNLVEQFVLDGWRRMMMEVEIFLKRKVQFKVDFSFLSVEKKESWDFVSLKDSG